jgi:ureidoglycolate lyase
MVALGDKPIDFVVVQYANGVGNEDCQEVLLQSATGSEGISVVVEVIPESPKPLRAKL